MNRSGQAGVRENAITEAVEIYSDRLRALIRRQSGDPIEADDVLQDVFVEFLNAYDLNVAIEILSAWLVKVARNKVLDRFRRRRTQRENQPHLELNASIESEGLQNSPDRNFTQTLLRHEIVEAIEQLPKEQRDVFIWHELEGLSFEEIAKRTGIGVNTLLSRKRYAILALRESLKEVYNELE